MLIEITLKVFEEMGERINSLEVYSSKKNYAIDETTGLS
jgi:hypothetical protein